MKNILFIITAILSQPITYAMTDKSEWNASDYHHNSKPQVAIAISLIEAINFEGDESILDICCGPGTITEALAQKVPEGSATGIDASLDMIEAASQQYKNHNLKFWHVKAELIEYNETFDMVSAFSCLHWIKNQQDVLNRIAKSLKPGGTFLATMGLKLTTVHPIISALSKTGLINKWKEYMPSQFLDENSRKSFLEEQVFLQNEETFEPMLKEAGLKTIELKTIQRAMTFQKEEFIQWLNSWVVGFSLIATIPHEKRTEFITDLVNNFIRNHDLEEDALIHYSAPILFIHAQKDS